MRPLARAATLALGLSTGALVLAGALGAAAPVYAGGPASNRAMVARGAIVFRHTCAPCHGAGPGNDGAKVLPAVAALQIKYKGKEPALIEHRTDLPYSVLKTFVRNGTVSMAPLRPTEITDAQIADVAAYIADTARKWKAHGKGAGR